MILNSTFELLKLLDISENDVTTMDAQDIYFSKGFTQEDLNDLKF